MHFLQTCKTVYNEAFQILYTQNTFAVLQIWQLVAREDGLIPWGHEAIALASMPRPDPIKSIIYYNSEDDTKDSVSRLAP